MSDSIFLMGDDGVLTEVTSTAYDTEADLQKLLADHVHILPGAQINRDRPRRWLLVKREAGVPNQEGGGDWWSLDHRGVGPAGGRSDLTRAGGEGTASTAYSASGAVDCR
jgi:hypothetical protein